MTDNLLSDEFLYSIWNFFEANLSPRTRHTYFNVVRDYVKIVQKEPLRLSQRDVEIYYNHLEKRLKSGQLSYSTVLMRISVMKNLCEYIKVRCNRQGKEYVNYFNNVILPDTDKTLKAESLPTDSDINNLLELVKTLGDDTAFLLFSLIIKCGLTTGEAISLTLESIITDTNNSICLQIPSKKKLARIIKLPADISELITNYICVNSNIQKEVSENMVPHIFYNRRHTPMKIRDAERLLKEYILTALNRNIISKEFTLQDLRHCAIKYMLMGGAGEDAVAGYCGITPRWMSRYRRVVNESITHNSADMSVITIKSHNNIKNIMKV